MINAHKDSFRTLFSLDIIYTRLNSQTHTLNTHTLTITPKFDSIHIKKKLSKPQTNNAHTPMSV